MVNLVYPKKQSVAFSNIMFALYELAKDTTEDKIIFDLSRSHSLTPFGIIMLTSTISECLRGGKVCSYKEPRDEKLKKFLTDIGFHKYFGLKHPTPEIESIRTGAVQLRKTRGIDPMLIETLTDILDYHLNISRGVKGSLRMSLQETMTNVIDHSGAQDYYVCCWNYPETKEIRLCIADLGIGIKASLKKSVKYASLTNDYKAITLSTEEDVSSRLDRAGMGLNHIKRFLSVNEGQLCIISGKGKVFWKFDQGKMLKQSMSQSFSGTIIKMKINTGKEGLYVLSDEKIF
jgi:anti-sigma regulatory factor (Ser/Thr protein kinase)